MTEQERKELNNEIDMLKGNINRMCVTDDISELSKMYQVAQKRIDKIHSMNLDRFIKEE